MPFGLFVSTQRRRKILQSMIIDIDEKDTDGQKKQKADQKREGEKILANFKKSLAEQKAREEAEKPLS
jgi:hypothetical protein